MGATESDSGGRKLTLGLTLTASAQRLANPFSVATRRRRGYTGTRFQVSMSGVASTSLTYAGEMMLLGWNDGPRGSTVTLALDPEPGTHPFMGCLREKDTWMSAFVEIADDEQPVDQKLAAAAEQAKPVHAHQKLSNQAAIMLKGDKFRSFIRQKGNAAHDDVTEAVFKELCDISSKSELDTNKMAAGRFKAILWEYTNR